MRRRWWYSLALFLCAGAICRADVTLHYTLDFKVSDAAPAAMTASLKQISAILPTSQLVRLKGTKTLSIIGPLSGIVDSADSTITLLNPATKQFAKMSMADYIASLQTAVAVPAAAQQALAGMNFDIASNDTGQTGMVAGIRATEHLLTLAMSMNLPGVPTPAGPLMRVEMHLWRASPDDFGRIPALREYSASVERAMSVFNPGAAMQQMFSQMPGFGDKFAAAMQDLSGSGNLTVKMQESIFMPILAQLAPGADPKLPIMETNMNLADISEAPLDDALFQAPYDYQSTSAAEMIKAIRPAIPATATPAPVAAARPPLAPGEAVDRVGNGVSQPSVIFKQDPEYSEAARKAKLSGTVLLSVVVDKDGLARDVRVVRPLGLGLDEKAIEAVERWRFKPGVKYGQPVNVRATIEINFLLLDDPLKQQ